MSIYRISYRYANSLFQLAEEKKITKKLAVDAELIASTLSKSKELCALLKNPIIKTEKKKEILSAIFDDKISNEIKVFLNFIIDKNREDLLLEIIKEFLNLVDNKEGVLRAKIISAVELDENLKKKIEYELEKREKREIKSEYIIDPAILGGYIIKFNDTVIDASLIHQLEKLKNKFYEDVSILNN